MPVRMDAAADRLLISSGAIDYNSPYTFMMWATIVSSTGAQQALWSMNDNTANNVDTLRTNTSGNGGFESRVSVAGAATVATDTLTVPLGSWHHWALVREGTAVLKMYMDGLLRTTNTKSVSGRAAVSRNEIGAFTSSNTQPAQMRCCAVKAWTQALDANQVMLESRSIAPALLSNLYGWWPLPAGNGYRGLDYSGNSHPFSEVGTLTDEDFLGLSMYPTANDFADIMATLPDGLPRGLMLTLADFPFQYDL